MGESEARTTSTFSVLTSSAQAYSWNGGHAVTPHSDFEGLTNKCQHSREFLAATDVNPITPPPSFCPHLHLYIILYSY